jgi:uncharacterized RDD family membrane protein YckC
LLIDQSIEPVKAVIVAVAVQMVELVLDEIDLNNLVRERIDLIGLADEVIDGVDLQANHPAVDGDRDRERDVRRAHSGRAGRRHGVRLRRPASRSPTGTKMTVPDEPVTAGIVSRGVAAVIDLVVVGAVIGLLYLGLVLSRLLINPTGCRLPALDVLFSTAVVLTVSALYLAGAWAVSGCTVGAVAMGLRVVGRRSVRLSLMVATVRAIACVLFPVGLLSVAVDRRRRSVQDILLGTRVVYVRR